MAMGVLFGSSRLSPLILWPAVSVSLILVIFLLKILYNLTLHPLSRYPGPKLWAATQIPYSKTILDGNPHKKILALHKYYNAEIIRISPNELSFQHPDALKEIMGHRKGKAEENIKDPDFVIDPQRLDIVTANRENHSRYRRILSHGFSARSIQEQQPIVKGYIDLFIERLHGISSKGPVDVVSWYNYATFDIISDLTFGEPFGCLAKSDYHPWVKVIFENIKLAAMLGVARNFKILEPFMKAFISKDLMKKGIMHRQLVHEKVNKRISLGKERPDFAEAMLTKASEPLSREEMYANADVLITAGSETTATALSGCTYFLTTNLDKLAKLTHEVRTSFSSEDEIDLLSTAKLEYLHAVLEEAMRAYPPIPVSTARVTPPRGQEIIGQWIPGNTKMSVSQWSLYHDDNVFSKPFEFHPERWLGDPAFKNDRFEALKPFHIGPRNCLGMNLAYAEMKMILARVIWNFDLQLAPESQHWLDHEVYFLWNKPALMIHMTPRKME